MNPGWNPDDVVCDQDGVLSKALGVGDKLPAAFLWSWRGTLLVQRGHVDEVSRVVEQELRTLPRVTIDEKVDSELKGLLRMELQRTGKMDVVAGTEEQEELEAIRRHSQDSQFSNQSACVLGQQLAANSLMKAQITGSGSSRRLLVQLFSAEKGCLTASAGVYWNAEKPEVSVAEAVTELVNNLRVPVEMPKAGGGKVSPGSGGGNVGGTVQAGVSMDEGENIVNDVTDDTGFLVVKTEPTGAIVKVNGKEVGRSPYQDLQMVGRYVVVAENGKLWHGARQELSLTEEGATVTLKLEPAFGTLRIEATPSDADIWIDGEKVGKGKYVNEQKPSGRYALRVEKEHYLSLNEEVIVEDRKETAREVTLERNFGSLRVTSTPPGATVALNGSNTGLLTPCEFPILQPGFYNVTLRLDGYGDGVVRAQVEKGHLAVAEGTLQAKLGKLSVMSSYKGGEMCEGEVFLDGERKGTTPWKGDVTARSHELRVVCKKGERKELVTIEHKGKVSLSWDIEAKTSPVSQVQNYPPSPSVPNISSTNRPRPEATNSRTNPAPSHGAGGQAWGRRANRVQGLELFGGGGVNFCMESGDAKCDDLDPNADIFFGGGYRFSPLFGIYLDGSVGWLTGDHGMQDISTLYLMPTFRGFATLRDAELFGGLGFGYSRMGWESDGLQASWSSWMNLKINVGGDIQISRNLFLGVNLDYIINFDQTGEFCAEYAGDKQCSDNNDYDIQDLIQATAFVKYRFN